MLLGLPEADCDTDGVDLDGIDLDGIDLDGIDLDSLIEIPIEEEEDDWRADDDWKAEFNQKKMQILEEVAAYTIEITDLDGSTTMTEDEVAEPIA